MATVTLGNPKGGSGKSTSTIVLAQTLVTQGASVCIIDCDPNRSILNWKAAREKRKLPIPFKIIEADEKTIVKTIAREAAESDFVLIDLEGTASKLVSFAFSKSDLVLVPLQPSPLDSAQAGRAIELIVEVEEVLGRPIRSAVAFNRTAVAIRGRIEKKIAKGLKAGGVHLMKNHLHTWSAFQAVFENGATLDELNPAEVSSIEKAKANALKFAGELVDLVLGEGAPAQPEPLALPTPALALPAPAQTESVNV